MQDKFVLLLFVVCPIFAFSQSYISADSANKIIMNGGDCSDRTFTKVEKLPSLRISKQAFGDSIVTYLIAKGISVEEGTILLQFVVNCHSQIKDIEILSSNLSYDRTLKESLLKYSGLWLPARQNDYIVNSYVLLKMKFEGNKLSDIILAQ